MEEIEESKREALTDRMRAARERGVVALQLYNTMRSKVSDEVIIAMEGGDDPIYYSTVIFGVVPEFKWKPLVCNGKDHVLALRELLVRNLDQYADKTYFIVDHDFDGLKGFEPRENTYCTPCYSIENLIVTEDVLVGLLIGEFRCDPVGQDIANIKTCFAERLDEFIAAMRLANQTLHFSRLSGRRSGSVENKIKKYVKIGLDGVTQLYEEKDLPKLVGLPSLDDLEDLSNYEADFAFLEPLVWWRGKFLLAFFVEFLAQLQEDRGCQEPQQFAERKSISFNPRSSIVRVLSSMSPPPDCLREFVQRIAA